MTPQPVRAFPVEKLRVEVYESEEALGQAAAALVEKNLQAAVSDRGEANLILATGTSQLTFLDALKGRAIDWNKITVFHLDEYRDLSGDHPASFRRYLREKILDAVQPKRAFLINGNADDPQREMEDYASELRKRSIDIACIGIGENGHIAFNDPPVADFNDAQLVKEVELDERCRMQQVNEGWFPSLEEAPRRAITLTIPAIMRCKVISCVVPGERKAEAVRNALHGPLSTSCPASILRRHDHATLMLDPDSAADS